MITFSFLSKTISMSGNIIGFGWEIRKLAFWKLSILDLICCPVIPWVRYPYPKWLLLMMESYILASGQVLQITSVEHLGCVTDSTVQPEIYIPPWLRDDLHVQWRLHHQGTLPGHVQGRGVVHAGIRMSAEYVCSYCDVTKYRGHLSRRRAGFGFEVFQFGVFGFQN